MNKYMQMANELSKQYLLTNNGRPFRAVIVKDGIVVGTSNNHVLRNNDHECVSARGVKASAVAETKYMTLALR